MLVGIIILGAFLGILFSLAFLIQKFERDKLETEVYWQLVNILVDYPDIVWEDIEFLLGTDMPNEEMRNLVRRKFAQEEVAEDIAREIMQKWFKPKKLPYTYSWLTWKGDPERRVK